MEEATNAGANTRGKQANGRPVEVNSSRFVRKDGVPGFEKSSGFRGDDEF